MAASESHLLAHAGHMCSAAARKGMACLPREGGSRGHRCGKVLGREVGTGMIFDRRAATEHLN